MVLSKNKQNICIILIWVEWFIKLGRMMCHLYVKLAIMIMNFGCFMTWCHGAQVQSPKRFQTFPKINFPLITLVVVINDKWSCCFPGLNGTLKTTVGHKIPSESLTPEYITFICLYYSVFSSQSGGASESVTHHVKIPQQ